MHEYPTENKVGQAGDKIHLGPERTVALSVFITRGICLSLSPSTL